MNKILLLLILSFSLVNLAYAATFEEQFNNKQYEQFLPAARAEAAKGNADALFLLGKANHLGLGVPVDLAQAKILYQQAREKGSARASHNLGNIIMDEGSFDEGVALLEEALNRGLKFPTLYNLAKAYNVSQETLNGFDPWDAKRIADNLIKSGDYYAQAYTLKPEDKGDELVSRQYLRAYLVVNNAHTLLKEPFDLPALRKQTVAWLQVGMDKNDATSWTNYGALQLEDKNYLEAKAALQKGAAQNVGVAYLHLGEMAEAGKGQPINKDEAIDYYEKATQLGVEEGRSKAQYLLREQLEYTSDVAKLELGVNRLNALKKPDDYDFSDSPFSPQSRLASIKAWSALMEKQKLEAKPLPDLPIVLNACELDLDQQFGSYYNLGWNTSWRLDAYPQLGEPEMLNVEGLITKQGCAFNDKLPEKVRALLENGAVLALHFPNYTLPLYWQKDSKTVMLRLMPIGSPSPDF